MARKEHCVLTNMCMVYSGDKILVQDRKNPDWPGITFPGGHVEPGESFVNSVIREVKEETGLDITDVRLCGMKQWTQRNGEYRYIVLFYKTGKFSGELTPSGEGEVFWIDKKDSRSFSIISSLTKPSIIKNSASLSPIIICLLSMSKFRSGPTRALYSLTVSLISLLINGIFILLIK